MGKETPLQATIPQLLGHHSILKAAQQEPDLLRYNNPILLKYAVMLLWARVEGIHRRSRGVQKMMRNIHDN